MRRIVLLSLVLSATVARAADPDSPLARSKALFEHAEYEYTIAHFAEALADYERAYEAKALPGLLFNIAQCHRQLGHYKEAGLLYRNYLDKLPTARNREVVLSLIDEMERKRRQQEEEERAKAALAPPVVAPAPAPAMEEPPPSVPAVALKQEAPPAARVGVPAYRRWYVWLAVGAAVAAAGLGVGLGVGLTSSSTHTPTGTLSTVDAR